MRGCSVYGTTIYFGDYAYVNMNGDPVERTPRTHPYNFDSYVIWKDDNYKEANCSCWSDRLLQWDYKKTRALMKKHFGNEGDYYDDRNPEDVEKFLQDYYDDNSLKLLVIMKGCNHASGYPLWHFWFKVDKED